MVQPRMVCATVCSKSILGIRASCAFRQPPGIVVLNYWSSPSLNIFLHFIDKMQVVSNFNVKLLIAIFSHKILLNYLILQYMTCCWKVKVLIFKINVTYIAIVYLLCYYFRHSGLNQDCISLSTLTKTGKNNTDLKSIFWKENWGI